jgi:hypothetical protein
MNNNNMKRYRAFFEAGIRGVKHFLKFIRHIQAVFSLQYGGIVEISDADVLVDESERLECESGFGFMLSF